MEQYANEIEGLKDELFCLRFEVEALADSLIRDQAERCVKGFIHSSVDHEHLQRYLWVSNFVHGKTVLDIACGCGFGSYLLADKGEAKHVEACDIDPKTIRYASLRYKHNNIAYTVSNAEEFKNEKQFDVIVSFETIEHIQNVEAYLKGMRNVLSKEGSFYLSTPISPSKIIENPTNPFHIREWGFFEFQRIIAEFFEIHEIYVQLWPSPHFSLPRRVIRIFKNPLELLRRELKACRSRLKEANMKPIPWNGHDFPAAKLGKEIGGYQILHCKKKC